MVLAMDVTSDNFSMMKKGNYHRDFLLCILAFAIDDFDCQLLGVMLCARLKILFRLESNATSFLAPQP